MLAHPRDNDGRLVPPRPAKPERPQTLEEEIATAVAAMQAFGVSAADQERAIAMIEAAHEARWREGGV